MKKIFVFLGMFILMMPVFTACNNRMVVTGTFGGGGAVEFAESDISQTNNSNQANYDAPITDNSADTYELYEDTQETTANQTTAAQEIATQAARTYLEYLNAKKDDIRWIEDKWKNNRNDEHFSREGTVYDYNPENHTVAFIDVTGDGLEEMFCMAKGDSRTTHYLDEEGNNTSELSQISLYVYAMTYENNEIRTIFTGDFMPVEYITVNHSYENDTESYYLNRDKKLVMYRDGCRDERLVYCEYEYKNGIMQEVESSKIYGSLMGFGKPTVADSIEFKTAKANIETAIITGKANIALKDVSMTYDEAIDYLEDIISVNE